MPLKLSTTIGKIQDIPNTKNIALINEFLEHMKNKGSSESHQNNNLKVYEVQFQLSQYVF